MRRRDILKVQFHFRIRLDDFTRRGLQNGIVVVAGFLLLAGAEPDQRLARRITGTAGNQDSLPRSHNPEKSGAAITTPESAFAPDRPIAKNSQCTGNDDSRCRDFWHEDLLEIP
jgi:hypothetical protein